MTDPTKHTRGRRSAFMGGVEGRYDVATDESEGVIAQNVRYEDASLIAAAPDMLAACDAVMLAFGEFITEHPDVGESPCIGLVRAAIAKARGVSL